MEAATGSFPHPAQARRASISVTCGGTTLSRKPVSPQARQGFHICR